MLQTQTAVSRLAGKVRWKHWWTKDEGDGSKLENQRTDVASVVSVQLMTIFFENLRRFVAERVFPKFKFIFKKQPWDRWWRWR
jgi:hypothetical protein